MKKTIAFVIAASVFFSAVPAFASVTLIDSFVATSSTVASATKQLTIGTTTPISGGSYSLNIIGPAYIKNTAGQFSLDCGVSGINCAIGQLSGQGSGAKIYIDNSGVDIDGGTADVDIASGGDINANTSGANMSLSGDTAKFLGGGGAFGLSISSNGDVNLGEVIDGPFATFDHSTGFLKLPSALVLGTADLTCDDSVRGTLRNIFGDSGYSDQLQVCQKLANDSYSWVTK